MSNDTEKIKTTITAVLRLVIGLIMIGAMLFLPAGTLKYWQAWAWLAAQFIPMGISLVYLLKTDPKLLERRTRTNETRPEQRRIILASVVYFLIIFLLPGFDVRYGWSNVPAWLSLVADVIVLTSYVLYVLVLKTNTFASRVIEVEQGQQVITDGPYALVRHQYISSAGLGVLLKTQKRVMGRGGGLTLVNASRHLRDLFLYSGFDRIFDIRDG